MELKSLAFSSFWLLITDAALLAMEAVDAETHKSERANPMARASILASALCLECAANRSLDSLKVGGKTSGDLERLSMIAKFTYFLGVSCGSVLDRSQLPVQRAQELKTIRDRLVHPKKMVGEVSEPDKISFGSFEHRGIPRLPLLWKADHAGSALEAAVGLLNYVFRDLRGFDRDQTCNILMSRPEFSPNLGPSTFAHRDASLEEAAARWGFDIHIISAAP